MGQSSDSPQIRPGKDHKDHKDPKDHPLESKPGEPTGAGHKLHDEASQEWFRQAKEARKSPLKVGDDQKYTVQHGDCLTDIAARRLHTDHEKVDGRSISKEEHRLRELNDKQYGSLDSKGKKRDFLADGWQLQIYDSVHTKPKAPEPTPRTDLPNVEPQGKPNAKPPEATVPLPVPRPADAPGVPIPVPRPADAPGVPLPVPRPTEAPGVPLPVPRPHDLDAPLAPPRRPEAPNSEEPERHRVKPEHDGEHEGRHHRHGRHHGRRHHRQPSEGEPGPTANPGPDSDPQTETRPPAPERVRPDHRKKTEANPDLSPESQSPSSPGTKLDRSRFYTHQTDAFSCSAVAMAMMHSDQLTGRPPSAGEVQHFKQVAGTTSHGYRGTLDDMASQCRSQGLNAKPYEYGRFGQQGMADLDRELAMGHSAVARIVNPHTGNPHYIFVAGKDANGQYIIGDPDRKNNAARGHDRPISRDHLYSMMSGRNGFVAGWS